MIRGAELSHPKLQRQPFRQVPLILAMNFRPFQMCLRSKLQPESLFPVAIRDIQHLKYLVTELRIQRYDVKRRVLQPDQEYLLNLFRNRNLLQLWQIRAVALRKLNLQNYRSRNSSMFTSFTITAGPVNMPLLCASISTKRRPPGTLISHLVGKLSLFFLAAARATATTPVPQL